jgi:hypothetical protein
MFIPSHHSCSASIYISKEMNSIDLDFIENGYVVYIITHIYRNVKFMLKDSHTTAEGKMSCS